jgi:hypothetical protein
VKGKLFLPMKLVLKRYKRGLTECVQSPVHRIGFGAMGKAGMKGPHLDHVEALKVAVELFYTPAIRTSANTYFG